MGKNERVPVANRYIKSANSYGHMLYYFHIDCLWEKQNAFYMQTQIYQFRHYSMKFIKYQEPD